MKKLNSGHAVGNTKDLKRLADKGWEIMSVFCDWPVMYLPRSKNDPSPWISHGGHEYGFRYRASLCYAKPPEN